MDLKSNHICYSLTGPVSVLAKSRPNEIAANGTHLDEAPAITSTRAFLLRGQPDTLICTSIVSAYLFWSAWGQRQTPVFLPHGRIWVFLVDSITGCH